MFSNKPDIKIVLPTNLPVNRKPGIYDDVYSIYKLKHNSYILNAAKTLKENEIRALTLDGKQMRTTKALLQLKEKLKVLYIVEINNETFNILCSKLSGHENIQIYNTHIGDFIKKNIDPKINVVYFDVMCSFFSSEKTEGSDIIIKQFLQQSEVDNMIFAATFCLRNGLSISFSLQKKKILTKLKILFILTGFSKAELLMNEDEVIYKGQKANNMSMMFVLFSLSREE